MDMRTDYEVWKQANQIASPRDAWQACAELKDKEIDDACKQLAGYDSQEKTR